MAVKSEKEKLIKKKNRKGVAVPFYTKVGVRRGTVSLPRAIFGQKVNKVLLAQALRVYRANLRSAQRRTLSRGEVNLTKRKVWRQKGIGLARHGARSAPLFVGGSKAHGPVGNENYKLSLPKKVVRKALFQALSDKTAKDSLLVADIEKVGPKTKDIARFLDKIKVSGRVGLVYSGATSSAYSGTSSLYRAGRNVADLELVPARQLSAFDVIRVRSLVLTRDAVSVLEDRLKEGK